MIVARRAPPIDVMRWLARHEAAVLPEILARAGAAAAVQAVNDRRGDAARFQDEPRNPRGELAAFADSRQYRVVLGVAASGLGHYYPMRAFKRLITLGMVSPSARAAKVNAMRCLSTGSASSSTSSTEGAKRLSSKRAGAHRQHQGLAGARAGAPGDQLAEVAGFRAGARRAHQLQDRVDHRLADRQAAHQPLRRDQLFRGHRRLGARFLGAGGVEQDFALGRLVGIVDVDFHQEAVELRLGQRIGAFLLERVLRRQHVERLGQIVAGAGDRHMLFLHRLQQRRLGARTGAVDLVGHQQLREHRAGDEAEAALAARGFLQHLGAENVGRHQVGRELHALGVQAERDAHGLHQLGLGEAGHADQQSMAAGQHGDQRALDHDVLAEDHRADGGLGGAHMGGGRFRRAHDHIFQFFQAFAA